MKKFQDTKKNCFRRPFFINRHIFKSHLLQQLSQLQTPIAWEVKDELKPTGHILLWVNKNLVRQNFRVTRNKENDSLKIGLFPEFYIM